MGRRLVDCQVNVTVSDANKKNQLLSQDKCEVLVKRRQVVVSEIIQLLTQSVCW